jgi:hypothetical protein
MNRRDEDTAAAIRDWVRDEIKRGPGVRVDLGKFFFAVSTISIGFFVTLKKIDTFSSSVRLLDRISIFLMCLSILVALLMILPGFRLLSGPPDLSGEYRKHVHRLLAYILLWFVAWFPGVMSGIWSVLH